MRIAINARSLQKRAYGGGNYIRSLVRHLPRVDPSSEFRIYVSRENLHHFADLKGKVELVLGSAMRPLRVVWEQTGLPGDLARHRIDVFHGPGFVSPLKKVCAQVVTIHDMTWFLFPSAHTPIKRHYFRAMIRLCARQADRLIAVSQSARKDIVRILGVSPGKVDVVHHGKDDRFRPIDDAEQLLRLRNKYGLQRGVILYVGLIEPRKNLERLIQAFARLRELHAEYRLVIAGERGWRTKPVLRAPASLGIAESVHFLGFIPEEDLPGIYNLADVFVYPSLYEGFGLPVLEAMACGVPVVTSAVSALPEVVGDAGLLVDPNSVEELARAIVNVLTDTGLRARMREKGLERSRLFSWDKAAGETLAVYQQAAAGAGAGCRRGVTGGAPAA